MFYKVTAKCGHVGKHNFILKDFYVVAKSKKDAAGFVKNAPRVKHDHKDVIRAVVEIDKEEYLSGISQNKNDGFFSVKNTSEQKRLQDYSLWNILKEEKQEKSSTRDKSYRIKKWKILELESLKQIRGVIYG